MEGAQSPQLHVVDSAVRNVGADVRIGRSAAEVRHGPGVNSIPTGRIQESAIMPNITPDDTTESGISLDAVWCHEEAEKFASSGSEDKEI